MNFVKKTVLTLFLVTQMIPLTHTHGVYMAQILKKWKNGVTLPKVSKNKVGAVANAGGAVVGLGALASGVTALRFFVTGADIVRVEEFEGRPMDNEFIIRLDGTPLQKIGTATACSVAFASLTYHCGLLACFFYKKANQASEEKK